MKVNHENKEYNLPDFLIVGAAKSGTTSLYYHLSNSKQVHFSKVKEPHFFTFYNNKPNFKSLEKLPTVVSSLKKYDAFFNQASKQAVLGEASTSYLYKHNDVISNIKNIYGDKAGDLKIIIVLRNPIERAWSQYWHFRKNFNETEPFSDTIKKETITKRMEANWNLYYNYIDFGMYTKQVKAYQENFNNVKIFLYDDLKKSTNNVLNELSNYLKINSIKLDKPRQFNPSGLPKKNIYGNLWKLNTKFKSLKKLKQFLPYKFRKSISNRVMEKALDRQVMDDKIRQELQIIYKEEINDLYNLLKREEIKQWC